MSSWTEQMGHPMIKVTAATFNAAAKTLSLQLEQSWFLADGSEAGADESKLWTIPLLYSTAGTVGGGSGGGGGDAKGAAEGEAVLMEGKTHTLIVPLEKEG
jgi:aminopeptidase N